MTGENSMCVHIPLLVYKAPLNMLTYMYQFFAVYTGCFPGGGRGGGYNVLDNLVVNFRDLSEIDPCC